MPPCAATIRRPLARLLLLALPGSLAAGCDAPPAQAGAATHLAKAAAVSSPADGYTLSSVPAVTARQANLTVQAAYPRLRPRPGTAPADTLGIRAFNRAAKTLVSGLVQEIAATARENRADQTPTALQVSFRPYLLRQGLASVAFTVSQDGIGPRPITWATGITYDLRTGRPVQPAALFQQTAAFKAAVLRVLQPAIAGNEACTIEPDNMAWDNFALGPDTYYLLLGDAQVGRACPTRAVRVPLTQLQSFAAANSPAVRLKTANPSVGNSVSRREKHKRLQHILAQ